MNARALPAPLQLLSRLLPFVLFLAAWQALAISGLIAARYADHVTHGPANAAIAQRETAVPAAFYPIMSHIKFCT